MIALMSGPFDYFILVLGLLLEAAVLACSLWRREFLRYLPLNLYVSLSAVGDVASWLVVRHFGLTSRPYFLFYYGSDLLLGLALYYVVIHLYQLTLANFNIKTYIRVGALALLVLTCAYSYRAARGDTAFLNARFAVELEQNLNFVGVVLTYFLWGAVMKLRETGTRLVQLILALGIYFSAIAAAYAARALFPQFDVHGVWRWAPPLISLWLPMAWSYAFLKIPTDARVLTRHVAVHAQ